MKMTSLLMSAIAVGLVSNVALGSISINQVVDPLVPDGYVANEIVWSGPADWTSSALLVNLPTGTAYQTPAAGGDGAPAEFMIGLVPELEFDTYVGIIGDGSAGIPGNPGGINPDPFSMDAPRINVSWANTSPYDFGPVRIGMITLSEDATGDWKLLSANVLYSGVVVNGAMVPEPATLGLLGLGGLALLRRR